MGPPLGGVAPFAGCAEAVGRAAAAAAPAAGVTATATVAFGVAAVAPAAPSCCALAFEPSAAVPRALGPQEWP